MDNLTHSLVGALMGQAVVVEKLFSWPGVGRLSGDKWSFVLVPGWRALRTASLEEVCAPLDHPLIATGKVRFVLREFPLDPLATAGFMLARCDGEGNPHEPPTELGAAEI